MVLKSFCGILALQTGVGIISSVFIVIAALTAGVNMFEYELNVQNSWPVEVLVVSIFVALMLMAGILLFMSAYKEDRRLCFSSIAVIAPLVLYWFILTVIALVNTAEDVSRVCFQERCGESFWIANFHYRTWSYITEDMPSTDSTDGTTYIFDPFDYTDYTDTTSTPERQTKTNTTIRKYFTVSSTTSMIHSESAETATAEMSTDKIVYTTTSATQITHNNTVITTPVYFTINKEPTMSSIFIKPSNITKTSTEKTTTEDARRKRFVEDRGGNSTVKEYSQFKMGPGLFGALLFAFINLMFFIYSLCLIWAYAEQVKFNSSQNNSQSNQIEMNPL